MMDIISSASANIKRRLKDKRRTILELVVLAVLVYVFFITLGNALRRIAIKQIEEITHTQIITESVDFNFDGSVVIKELQIASGDSNSQGDPFLQADTVYVRFSMWSLMRFKPKIKALNLDDFVFSIENDIDRNKWNLSDVKISLRFEGKVTMPLINLRRGIVKYSRVQQGRINTIEAIPIHGALQPEEDKSEGYSFRFLTGTTADDRRTNIFGTWKKGNLFLAGDISSLDIPVLGHDWYIEDFAVDYSYETKDIYNSNLSVRNFYIDPNRTDKTIYLFENQSINQLKALRILGDAFRQYKPSGRYGLDLNIEAKEVGKNPILSGSITCKDSSIFYEEFPYKLEHITGNIDVKDENILLKNLRGEHKDVNVLINGWINRSGTEWESEIRISSDNLAFDEDLYHALDERVQHVWSLFNPSGFAKLDYRYERKEKKDSEQRISLDVFDGRAKYVGFEYPLENITGQIIFDRKTAEIDLVSKSGVGRLAATGTINNLEADVPEYEITITGNDIALDEKVSESFEEEQKNIYNSLQLDGIADVNINVINSEPNSLDPAFHAHVILKDASLQPGRFPFRITNVFAETVMDQKKLHIESFKGTLNEGSVDLSGDILRDDSGLLSSYSMKLNADGIELSDKFADLLPRSAADILLKMNPQGKVSMKADIIKESSESDVDYDINLSFLGNRAKIKGLPIELTEFFGDMNIKKSPDFIEISLKNMSSGIEDINSVSKSGGRIGVDGELLIPKTEDINNLAVNFNCDIRLDNYDFNTVPSMQAENVSLRAKGVYKPSRWFESGEAIIDAKILKVANKRFENVESNVYFDPNTMSWIGNDLSGDCYGGKFAGRFEIGRDMEDQSLRYLLQTGFNNMKLEDFLCEPGSLEVLDDKCISGLVRGSLDVSGKFNDINSRLGSCRINVTDMQVGRLSPLAQVLAVLKMTDPTDYAFENMLVNSYIKENKTFIKNLDISGKSLAFTGSGWLDLHNNEVNMSLAARGGRLAGSDPSLWQSLTEGLGQAVVRIEVTGDLNDPKVNLRTWPVLKESLEIIGKPEQN